MFMVFAAAVWFKFYTVSIFTFLFCFDLTCIDLTVTPQGLVGVESMIRSFFSLDVSLKCKLMFCELKYGAF